MRRRLVAHSRSWLIVKNVSSRRRLHHLVLRLNRTVLGVWLKLLVSSIIEIVVVELRVRWGRHWFAIVKGILTVLGRDRLPIVYIFRVEYHISCWLMILSLSDYGSFQGIIDRVMIGLYQTCGIGISLQDFLGSPSLSSSLYAAD